jgi:uncharacterized protein (DUF983 family)
MPPSPVTVLARGLAGRCPACGCGHVFGKAAVPGPPGAVASARACEVCGWRFERCAGHWVGGNEVNLLAAFSAGVAAWAASAAFLGLTPAAAWIATAATGVFSVASYRRCRCVFFAIDYLLDPEPDTACAAALRDDERDDGCGDRDRRRDTPDPPRPIAPDGPAARARVPSPAGSSESFIAPPRAPYPPPATVSP